MTAARRLEPLSLYGYRGGYMIPFFKYLILLGFATCV